MSESVTIQDQDTYDAAVEKLAQIIHSNHPSLAMSRHRKLAASLIEALLEEP